MTHDEALATLKQDFPGPIDLLEPFTVEETGFVQGELWLHTSDNVVAVVSLYLKMKMSIPIMGIDINTREMVTWFLIDNEEEKLMSKALKDYVDNKYGKKEV